MLEKIGHLLLLYTACVQNSELGTISIFEKFTDAQTHPWSYFSVLTWIAGFLDSSISNHFCTDKQNDQFDHYSRYSALKDLDQKSLIITGNKC